ncbi:hypothetical protein FXO38_32316 [Capsicum annuum]|nr:hypothetical protein FXO37_35579 [Capsicum annuum]KAF3620516.1 hypothetical protein FXO38_32316 [Capsicum annuum]
MKNLKLLWPESKAVKSIEGAMTTDGAFAFAISEAFSAANRGAVATSHTISIEPLARRLATPCLCRLHFCI